MIVYGDIEIQDAPYVGDTKNGGKFASIRFREFYTDKEGNDVLKGYWDGVAFDEVAEALADLPAGTRMNMKATLSQRPNDYFQSPKGKPAYQASFVIQNFELKDAIGQDDLDLTDDLGDEEDIFG